MNKLDEALDRYHKFFGENYPICIGENREADELIADIELCIDTGNKAETPIYEEDVDY